MFECLSVHFPSLQPQFLLHIYYSMYPRTIFFHINETYRHHIHAYILLNRHAYYAYIYGPARKILILVPCIIMSTVRSHAANFPLLFKVTIGTR